ncbi:MAG: HDOD domain-containing protein [Planctomycetes bacterium]|nr:HDOD domain-containing protein [Planctomycetota bacterium]
MSRTLEIIRSLRTTPPLPSVALRLMDLVREPGYSVDAVVDLVSMDPSLTARVLRLTNSAMFALPAAVTTVPQAVTFVGSRNLVKLALVSCAANQFRDVPNSIYGTTTELWRHTYAVAATCQLLAGHCGFADTSTAFTAGILHNVGKVALTQTIGDEPLPEIGDEGSHVEREASVFGIDHAAAAGVIADAWALPRDLAAALRAHHDEDAVRDGSLLVALVAAADDIVLAAGIGNAFPDLDVRVSPATCERLQLTTDDIECLTADAIDELGRNAELLNLEGITDR